MEAVRPPAESPCPFTTLSVLLAKFPMQGRAGRIANTRELVLAGLPYLVVYRVSEDEVQILRLLHGAQEWP